MNYFFIENTYNGTNTIRLTTTKSSQLPTAGTYATTVEYSKDQTNWTTYNLSGSALSIALNRNEKLYFRNNSGVWSTNTSVPIAYVYFTFSGTNIHYIGGDIRSLLDYTNDNVSLVEYCFYKLFENDTNLRLFSPETLLPSTTLASYCYKEMFSGCSGVQVNQEFRTLPATTLASGCYDSMFKDCTSLNVVPTLPATTLAYNCYKYMFSGCTSLIYPPTLPATTLAQYCYNYMFSGCTNLKYVETYANNISATGCIQNWLNNVSATGKVYNMGSATYTTGSASGIPSGWSESIYFYIDNLSAHSRNVYVTPTITDLENPICATSVEYKVEGDSSWTTHQFVQWVEDPEMGEGWYEAVQLEVIVPAGGRVYFRGIDYKWSSYIEYIDPETEEPAGDCLDYITFAGDNNSGDEYAVGGDIMTLIDWTSQPSIGDHSFYNLFESFTKLTDASDLRLTSTTLANNCYDGMFRDCTSLTAAPALPATTLAQYCYSAMFNGCTALTTAPVLPATTLVESCYEIMFSWCTSLNEVTTYADDISATGCLDNWLYNVSNSGTFNNNGSATYTPNSASGIPTGWTEVGPTPSTYTITATAGSNGSISPSGSVSVNAGANQTFTVTPDTGYEVDTLTVDGSTATLTNNTYTFSNVSATHTISVTFKLPDLTDYFYIENTYNGQNTVTLSTSKSGSPTAGTYATSVEYSKDKSSWTTLSLTAGGTNTITLETGEKVYFRNDSGKWNDFEGNYKLFYTTFTANQNHTVGGNINTLLDYTDLNNVSLSTGCFYRLFNGDNKLTSVSSNFLPATTLANYCYKEMFNGCTSLTAAPTLPATTLANSCYSYMFQSARLTAAPALPATTLAPYCYQGMFQACTSLTAAPTLPATTLANGCYEHMFASCTSLTTAPTLPATTLANYCYQEMFSYCASMRTYPELPATTLAEGCYKGMFWNARVYNNAPALPATTLAPYCYSGMFYAAGVTAAPALPATTLAPYCYNTMFTFNTSLTTAPTLPATTLANKCYSYMFQNCSSLNSVTTYADDISATDCLDSWLQGVAATGTFHNNGSATYTVDSPSGIPVGWTEVLPSKTITATAGQNGSISPSGAVSVNIGSDQTFTFTPDTGYEVDTVTVDGSTVTPTNNTYTFTNVQADHTISVTFKVQTFTINAISEGHTIVNPSGFVTVNYGADQTFTFSPAIGYELDKLYIDGVETAFSGSSYTFTNVQSDHTLEITSKLRTFTIEASSSEGGSITPDGIITVEYGSDKTFTLEANAGHLLWELTVDGVDRKSEVVDDSFTFENVTADHTIHPVWDDIYLIVTATSGPNGTITPTGDVEVIYNGNQIFNLTPNEGYEIDTLLLDGTDVTDEIEDFNYTMRNIVENHILEVSFKEKVIPTTNGFNLTEMKNVDYTKQYYKK